MELSSRDERSSTRRTSKHAARGEARPRIRRYLPRALRCSLCIRRNSAGSDKIDLLSTELDQHDNALWDRRRRASTGAWKNRGRVGGLSYRAKDRKSTRLNASH